MSRAASLRTVTEFIGHVAVVLSLVYVGVQVKQNTAAIQTATSQDVYEYHRARAQVEMESPEFADFLVRVQRDPASMTAADSVRYNRYLNLTVNLQEAVYTNAVMGTMQPEMAAGWLAGLPSVVCTPGLKAYWDRRRTGYHRDFMAAMDSVIAETSDCDAR